MPPRHKYWTIIVEGRPTAFRAHTADELLPTLRQLANRHPDAVLRWYARGRLWDSQEHERQQAARRTNGERRGPEWRPGGEHRDPRQRFNVPRDEKRRRFAAKLRRERDRPPQERRPPGAQDERARPDWRSDRPPEQRPQGRRDWKPHRPKDDRPGRRADSRRERRGETPTDRGSRHRGGRPPGGKPAEPRRPDRSQGAWRGGGRRKPGGRGGRGGQGGPTR